MRFVNHFILFLFAFYIIFQLFRIGTILIAVCVPIPTLLYLIN